MRAPWAPRLWTETTDNTKLSPGVSIRGGEIEANSPPPEGWRASAGVVNPATINPSVGRRPGGGLFRRRDVPVGGCSFVAFSRLPALDSLQCRRVASRHAAAFPLHALLVKDPLPGRRHQSTDRTGKLLRGATLPVERN